jgi:glycerol-1-phosphate dehydrogenase [NAD(P)+]
MIGEPFTLRKQSLLDVLGGLPRFTLVASDPPWSRLAQSAPKPERLIIAGDTDLTALDAIAAEEDAGEVVIGIGGGAAMDGAKHLAWRQKKPVILAPTITSVDAAFTDAIGVRVDRRVRYIGQVRPLYVALDVPLIRAAPAHLNRAGLGDILSCHTGLFDWRLATEAGHGPPWRKDLAALGRDLLRGLEDAIDDIAAVSEEGVRFLARAYQRVGAACAEARHSRFEEGSEHFWAYAYEARTGAHHVHGELIAMAVVAMSVVQDHDPAWAADIVARGGVRAHPADLGIAREDFVAALLGLSTYARAEKLDWSIADARPIAPAQSEVAWCAIAALPRRSVS